MPMLPTYAHECTLLQRCAAGDTAAFDSLVKPYLAAVSLYTRHRVDDRDDAEDLLQDLLEKAYDYVRQHPGTVMAFFPWLQTVTRHMVTDFLRQKVKHLTSSLDEAGTAELADAGPSPEECLIAHEQQETTETLWEFLSAHLQEVFVSSAETEAARVAGLLRLLAFLMYYRDGLTVPDIQGVLTAHAARLASRPPPRRR